MIRRSDDAPNLASDPRLTPILGDLENPGDWIGAVKGAQAVLHLAHIGFAQGIVSACRDTEVQRLICLSSTRRFTRFPDSGSRRVVAGEKIVEGSGLDFTILRPTMIYGPPRDNNVERIVDWLGRRRWMPLIRGGKNLVQPIFVDDVADAIVQCVAHPRETRALSFTLAGPESLTWREFVETIAQETGHPVSWIPVPYAVARAGAGLAELISARPFVTRDQVRRLLEDKAFGIEEASRALGAWQPRALRDGLRLKLAAMDS